jgi:trypsin
MRSLLIFGVLLATGPDRIVRRGDRDDRRYLEAGAKYPAVVALGRAGDATLVAPQWLLTAGHVASSVRAGTHLKIAGGTYDVARVIVHQGWRELGPHDVGLIRLSRPVTGVEPLGVYHGNQELGLVAVLVGHGAAGRGDSRERADDGRARAATSRVDSVSADWLYFSFDAPPAGTDLEGAPGPGDSGGPAVITVADRAVVAGVSSAGYDGRDGPGSYGAVDAFTRVSTHAAWIDSVMRSGRATERGAVSSASQRAIAAQGVTLPDSPVGKRYAAFLAAMRSGTDSAIVGFLEANFDERELASRPARDRLPNFRRLAERLRDARIEAITKAAPLQLTARLVGAAGVTTIEMLCAAEVPNKIIDWRRYD